MSFFLQILQEHWKTFCIFLKQSDIICACPLPNSSSHCALISADVTFSVAVTIWCMHSLYSVCTWFTKHCVNQMQTLPFYATQKKVFFYVCKVCYIFICSLNVPFRVKSHCGLKLSLMAVIRRDNAMKRTSKQNLVSWNCDVHKVVNVASGFSVLCVSTIRFTHRKLSQKEMKRLINLELKVVL